MNLHKIENLTTIAARLADAGSAASGVIQRIVGLIDKEIDAAEPNAQAEEIQALQASNDIKQANLNLLADKVLKLFNNRIVKPDDIDECNELQLLACDLYQKEQSPGLPESFGGPAGTGKTFNCAAAIDPVAQVVDNLKNARAEVLRLIELRKLTSADDERITAEWKEACNSFNSLKDELTKAIDASIKE